MGWQRCRRESVGLYFTNGLQVSHDVENDEIVQEVEEGGDGPLQGTEEGGAGGESQLPAGSSLWGRRAEETVRLPPRRTRQTAERADRGSPRTMTRSDMTTQKTSFRASASRLTDAGRKSYLFSAKGATVQRRSVTNQRPPPGAFNREQVHNISISFEAGHRRWLRISAAECDWSPGWRSPRREPECRPRSGSTAWGDTPWWGRRPGASQPAGIYWGVGGVCKGGRWGGGATLEGRIGRKEGRKEVQLFWHQ